MSEPILITDMFVLNEGPNEGEPYLLRFNFSDGRAIWVEPQLFGARLIVGRQDDYPESFDDVFYYNQPLVAILAAMEWALEINTRHEPDGWYRNPKTSRRRKNGDPTQEYLLN